MTPLRFRNAMIFAEISKLGLAFSSSSNFQVSLVSRKIIELFQKVVNLDSEFLRMEDADLPNPTDLKGDVPDEDRDSMFVLAFEEDLRSILDADYIVLVFLLLARLCVKYFLINSCTYSSIDRDDCI
jgi:hypothetical protein